MVVIRKIEANRTIDIGGIPSTQIDDGIGRGLQQVGGAVSNHAARLLEMKRQDQAFATQQAFNQWNDDNSLEFTKLQEGIAVSGDGFADTAVKTMNERAEAFMRTVPPELQEKMSALVSTAVNQWENKSIETQITQRNSWFDGTLTKRAISLEEQAFNNPDQLRAIKETFKREVAASGLPPKKQEEWDKNSDVIFSMAVGKRMIIGAEADPSSVRDIAARLGIPSAATGQAKRYLLSKTDKDGSHISGMQDGFAGKLAAMIQAAPPEIQAGLGIYSGARSNERQSQLWQEALVKYGSPEAARKWVAPPGRSNHNHGSAADLSFNGKSLKHAPKEVIAWAHQNAERYGLKFPLANENWHIEDASTRGGKHAEGETGKANSSSRQKMQADPNFANLSLTQKLTLYDQAMAAAQRGQTTINAQNNAAYDSKNSALLLGIQENKITSTEQIYAAGLKDSDTLAALKALESRQKDNILTADAVAAFQNGTLKVDPYSSDDRKKVDAIGKMIETVVPEDQRQASVEKLVSQTGSVPETYFNKIRAGLDSQTPNDFGRAMEMAYRLNQANPVAFGRSAGGDAIQKKVNDYDYMINKLAMKPEEAWKRLAEENNPDKTRDRKALEPLEKQFVKDLTDGDLSKQVVQIFDEWWTSDPQVGFTNQTSVAIQADYLEMARREFVRNGGDADRAKDNASKQMKDLYGVTQITGSKVIMRNPPDNYWPHVPNVPDPLEYVKTQLIDELKAAFPDDNMLSSREDPNGITMTINGISFDKKDVATRRAMESRFRDDAINRVRLTPLLSTQQEIDAKKMPGYMVSYVDEKGNEQVLNNGRPWKPDFTAALNAQREERLEREAIAASVGKQMRGIAEDQMIMGQMEDGGREASLDAFIAGPASTPQAIANPNPGFSAPVPQSANPSVQGNLKQQRTQLFQNAKDSGMLNGDQ